MCDADREKYEAQAKREWLANHENVQGTFMSEKTYVAWRVNDLRQEEKGSRR